MNIRLLTHSSILVENEGKNIYFDPFNIKDNSLKADYIFITHDHFDHFSLGDINKIKKEDTIFILPFTLKGKVNSKSVHFVKPYDNLNIDELHINVRPAYNINKRFHPKENNWVGYILDINNTSIYVMGDTDALEENTRLNVDYLLIPIGGTYTMTKEEAVDFTNKLNPKFVIPIHYGQVVGSEKDGLAFKALINKNIKVLVKKEY